MVISLFKEGMVKPGGQAAAFLDDLQEEAHNGCDGSLSVSLLVAEIDVQTYRSVPISTRFVPFDVVFDVVDYQGPIGCGVTFVSRKERDMSGLLTSKGSCRSRL